MKMPTLAVTLAVTLVVLAAYGWHRSEVRRAIETAAAQRSRDSLVTAVAADRAERAARYAADSASYEAARKRAASELAAARRMADESAGGLARLLDSLGAVLPDTLGPFAQRILAGWTAHLDADLAERVAADAALAERDARYVAFERAYAADLSNVNTQIDECVAQLDRAIRRTNPGLLTRIWRALPPLALVGVGGYVVGHLTR